MARPHRILHLVSLIALPVVLLSCGGSHDSDEFYVLVSANLQVSYWKTAGSGFSNAASQFKVRSDFTGPQTYDPKAEREALDQAVQNKATGILLGVTDPALLKDSIDKAVVAGIPVITIDSDAPSSKRLFFIGTNNYQAGFTGGQRLAQELKGKGNVVVFTMPDQSNLQDRLRGYKDALARTPEIKITRVVDIQGDPRIAFDTTTQIIGKERDKVDAFVCLEAQSGKEVAGVLNSYHVDRQGRDRDGYGSGDARLDQEGRHRGDDRAKALHHGLCRNADARQPLPSQAAVAGYGLVERWVRAYPSFVDTGSALIDKSNVDSFIQAGKNLATAPK